MALSFANKITIFRIILVPVFIAVVLYYSPEKDYLRFVALGIFMFAIISDIIDGYIARTRHQKTKAGAILDPLADKLLVMSAFICLYKIGIFFQHVHFPAWLVIAVISRDTILLLGVMIVYIFQSFTIEPSLWGKAAIFLQVACIIGVLLQWSVTSYLWIPTLVLAGVSGVDYMRKAIKILNNPEAKR